MNEVEKMYENAGVEPDYDYFTLFDDKVHKIGRTMHLCKEELKHWLKNYQKDYVAIKVIRVDKDYPPFTAEKQLELIKWLSNNDKDKNKELTLYNSAHPYYYFGLHHKPAHSEDDMWGYGEGLGTTFEDGLAELINNIWQDLTDAEKAQIKNILESEVRE